MNLFIVSSPFQYMFATIIAKHYFSSEENIAVYYEFQENFSKEFDQISQTLNFTLPIRGLEITSKIGPKDTLFFSNRYNSYEVKCATKAKKIGAKLCLFEDGLNMYLSHQFSNEQKNDTNKALGRKNFLKSLRGKDKSHIYHKEIDAYYSFFKDLPIPTTKTNHTIISSCFRSEAQDLDNSLLQTNSCIVLSQWFVRQDYINERDYMSYIASLIETLDKRYDTIYYKPHPRDYLSFSYWVEHELNASLLPAKYQRLPVELLLLKSKTDIYGFGSAALIYAKEFMGCNAYTMIADIAKKYPSAKLKSWCKTSSQLLSKYNLEEFKF